MVSSRSTMQRALSAAVASVALCLPTAAAAKSVESEPVAAAAARTSASERAEKFHEVRPGQTLGGIAQRHQVSVAALCRLNGISRKQTIRPGQRLFIPRIPGKIEPAADKPAPAASQRRPAAAAMKAKPSAPTETPGWRAYRRPAPKAGYVTLVGTAGKWSGYAILAGDLLSPRARAGFRRVLASWRTGKQIEVPERLMRLLVEVSDTFGGRTVRIVGGYRERSYAPASKHRLGHAVDFSVDGVPNSALKDFLLTLPDVGVGYYPNSSFVHLDVRTRPAYWIDHSRPGEPPRYPRGGTPKVPPAKTPPASGDGISRSVPPPVQNGRV